MQWQVSGADRDTGDERSIIIEADTEDSATRRGNRQGLFVSNARLIAADETVDDLENIATAYQTFDGKKKEKATARAQRRRRISVITAVFIVLILGVTSGVYFMWPVVAVKLTGEPGFSVRLNEEGNYFLAAIVVTNEKQEPLRIDRVVYNGEHSALPGGDIPYSISRTIKLPVTLSVGQDFPFFLYRFGGAPESYDKHLVFVDFYTDRGNFRYSMRDGFIAYPPYAGRDLPGLEAKYDADTAAAAKARPKGSPGAWGDIRFDKDGKVTGSLYPSEEDQKGSPEK